MNALMLGFLCSLDPAVTAAAAGSPVEDPAGDGTPVYGAPEIPGTVPAGASDETSSHSGSAATVIIAVHPSPFSEADRLYLQDAVTTMLRNAGADPSAWTLRIVWGDRASFELEATLSRRGEAPSDKLQCGDCDRQKLTAALEAEVTAVVRDGLARHPPPSLPKPPAPPTTPEIAPVTPAPLPPTPPTLARALGGTLVVLGAGAVIAGTVLIAKNETLEYAPGRFEYELEEITTDYRTPGIVVATIGAAGLIAGVTWLAIAETRFRRDPRSHASLKRPRVRPGLASLEVVF